MTTTTLLHRAAACTLVAGLAVSFHALAQTAARGPGPAYPVKPLRVIVPFAPGGGSDITARVAENGKTKNNATGGMRCAFPPYEFLMK